MVVFERGDRLVFIFNFHSDASYSDYRIGVQYPGPYKVALSTDAPRFGGYSRIDVNSEYHTTPMPWNDRANWIQVYIPARTALVLYR